MLCGSVSTLYKKAARKHMSISWLHGSDQQGNGHTGIIQMQGILSATYQMNIPSMLSQLVLPAQAQA